MLSVLKFEPISARSSLFQKLPQHHHFPQSPSPPPSRTPPSGRWICRRFGFSFPQICKSVFGEFWVPLCQQPRFSASSEHPRFHKFSFPGEKSVPPAAFAVCQVACRWRPRHGYKVKLRKRPTDSRYFYLHYSMQARATARIDCEEVMWECNSPQHFGEY